MPITSDSLRVDVSQSCNMHFDSAPLTALSQASQLGRVTYQSRWDLREYSVLWKNWQQGATHAMLDTIDAEATAWNCRIILVRMFSVLCIDIDFCK